ncbi:MAG: hypothetical protein Q9179_007146 [Wetmoreana sp. 5 TL-2023]
MADSFELEIATICLAGKAAQQSFVLVNSPRQGFSNRQAGRSNGTANTGQQRSQNASPIAGTPTTPSVNGPVTFPANPSANVEDTSNTGGEVGSEPTKWFFKEAQAKLSVKGNFIPLAAKPVYLDLGDWIAHQTVEQCRLMQLFLAVIQEVNGHTGMQVCNPSGCPTMSAGRHYTYTWLNNDRTPIRVPACQYIALVQRWIVGKIHDPVAFPTHDPFGSSAPSFGAEYASTVKIDPETRLPIPMPPTTLNRTLSDLSGRDWVGKSMGFPEAFLSDVRTAWRQMFRIYAHLYHSHFIEPFWHINNPNTSDLNSSFCFFVSVGKLFGLLSDRDLEPMHELIDIWIANGSIPVDCARGASAIVQ